MNFPLILADDNIAILAVIGGLILAAIGMITSAIRRTRTEQAREESRREIAAYVAEGSISADDAAKLIDAGKKIGEGSC